MTLAEKLVTVAENQEKVYVAGQKSMGLTETVTGNPVALTSVHETEHEVGVKLRSKNLLKLTGRTIVDFGDAANTTKRSFTGNGVIIGITANNIYNPNVVTDAHYEDGAVSGTGSTSGYGIGFDLALKPSAQYVFSCSESVGRVAISQYDADGNYLRYDYVSNTPTITTTDNTAWGIVVVRGEDANMPFSCTNPQLELGATATPYAPYVSDFSGLKVRRYGKNLLHLEGREFVNFGATPNTTKRTFPGDNGAVYAVTTNNYYSQRNASGVNITASSVHGTSPDTGYGVGFAVKLFPNTAYAFSCAEIVGGAQLVEYSAEGALVRSEPLSSGATVTTDSNAAWGLITFRNPNGPGEFSCTNPQFELGDTATAYEPGVAPTEHLSDPYGVVYGGQGVKSLSPTTTLVADNGVLIDAEYFVRPGGRVEDNPFYYATSLNSVCAGAVFPENYEAVIRVKKAPKDSSYIYHQAAGYKSSKLISEDNTGVVSLSYSHRVTAQTPMLELVDLTEYSRKLNGVQEAFRGQKKLKSVLGALDLSECTTAANVLNIFFECFALEDVEFVPNTIKISIAFDAYGKLTKLTKASLTSIINGLSPDVTGQTVTLSQTAVNNAFTTEEWNALVATKTNWTIALA